MLNWSKPLAWSAFVVGVMAMMPAPDAAAEPAATPQPVARVHATYHITWNGLDLGDFTWDSAVNGGKYKAATSANISALFGAYTWEGATHSSGDFITGEPHPANYKFKFRATDKSGQITMGFVHDKVVTMVEDPPDRGTSGRIPLKPAHMENVLDPLSAIMALSSPGAGRIDSVNPCQRHLAVFDGRQRFDLVLSYKRKTRIEGGTGAKFAYVCQIQYVPIAGHKMNTETKYMASADGIEIWLAPVPAANAFVPVNVVIPTWAGSAQITSTRVQIDVPGKGRIALSSK